MSAKTVAALSRDRLSVLTGPGSRFVPPPHRTVMSQYNEWTIEITPEVVGTSGRLWRAGLAIWPASGSRYGRILVPFTASTRSQIAVVLVAIEVAREHINALRRRNARRERGASS